MNTTTLKNLFDSVFLAPSIKLEKSIVSSFIIISIINFVLLLLLKYIRLKAKNEAQELEISKAYNLVRKCNEFYNSPTNCVKNYNPLINGVKNYNPLINGVRNYNSPTKDAIFNSPTKDAIFNSPTKDAIFNSPTKDAIFKKVYREAQSITI